MAKLYVHLTLESEREIKRYVSLARVRSFLNEKLQERFPEYDVEIGDIKTDIPGDHQLVDLDKDDSGSLV